MLPVMQELLSNPHVRQQIQEATDVEQTIQVIVTAGAEKGYTVTSAAVSQVLAELSSTEDEELSEAELLLVSGGESPHTKMCPHCYKEYTLVTN
jgi:non-ribosomal peptide synthetase component E (peptide arylation enzyme)